MSNLGGVRRAGFVAILAAGLLTATSLMAATGAESATLPSATTTGVTPTGGWLTVETGTVNQVAYDANHDGTPESVQPLTSSGCILSTDQSLLKISGYVSGNPTPTGFQGGDLGVADRATGQTCAQVNAPLERLDLQLALGKPVASSASLDMELKGSVRVLATATLKGQVVGQYELRSGDQATTKVPLPGGATPTTVVVCNVGDSSGEDRARTTSETSPRGHCRWPISSPSWLGADDGIFFDTLSLQALKGAFSLDGGGDGLLPGAPPAPFPGKPSLFEIAPDIIGCGQTGDTLPGSLTAPQVTVTRIGNANAAESCLPLAYTLTNGPGFTRFLKPQNVQTSSQFVVNVSWTVPAGSPAQLPITYVDYESGFGATALPWCPDPTFSDAGVLTGIENPLTSPLVVDQDSILTNKQFACVGTQSARVVNGAPDTVTVTEQIYLLGDVLMRK
jgi:hypothetical protein